MVHSSKWKAEKALVLLSGGQDSTTCLYWAKAYFGAVEAVSFDYGQRHQVELEAAKKICAHAGVPHTIIPVNSLRALGGAALTDERIEIKVPPEGLPTTFVPGRNILFLTLAAALAYQKGIQHIVTGVCQTDYSGYPDCRSEAIAAIQLAISLGMGRIFYIHTPLMWLTKAETARLAQEVGALEALSYSHTCYRGVYPPCGECPACQLRAKGFQEAGIPDPILSRE
jgi:7-cyano-7-deazaguanine synthase